MIVLVGTQTELEAGRWQRVMLATMLLGHVGLVTKISQRASATLKRLAPRERASAGRMPCRAGFRGTLAAGSETLQGMSRALVPGFLCDDPSPWTAVCK